MTDMASHLSNPAAAFDVSRPPKPRIRVMEPDDSRPLWARPTSFDPARAVNRPLYVWTFTVAADVGFDVWLAFASAVADALPLQRDVDAAFGPHFGWDCRRHPVCPECAKRAAFASAAVKRAIPVMPDWVFGIR